MPLALCLILLLALAGPTPPVAAAAPADFSALDAAARDAVASGDIPGVVAMVGRGPTVLYLRAFGSRQVVAAVEPMTTDTIFDIASLTKPLGTTLAIMSLVEGGKIRLDAPLGRYLREFRAHAFRGVTIARLLTHSAGLSPAPSRSLRMGFPAAARVLAAEGLDDEPGRAFHYSDTGFILLGEVVRRVSGLPLDRYLAGVLFRPLGLRSTFFRPGAAVRQRIAPTETVNGHPLRGEVHDPRARELGGVAGHAGMFSTAGDIGRILGMLVDGGAWGGRRLFRAATIRTMWAPSPEGEGSRTLGWDLTSGYARPMAPFFPMGSVGHTGFTGTAVWVDPASRTFVIVLTNRVHPNGGGAARVRELRTRAVAAVGAALFAGAPPRRGAPAAKAADEAKPREEAPPAGPPRPGPVRSGLDVLGAQDFALLRGQRIGLVTNQTGVDARGRRGIDLIAGAPDVSLQAIFSPEHGLGGTANAEVPNGRDAATGLPVWSLYGATRRPTAEMLRGVSMLVYDIQDVGVRYYTYLTTLLNVLEEAGARGLPVVVLDRPNPITGRVVEGPIMDADLRSFTAPHPLPVRTGLTIGEYARLVVAERKLPVSLTVVPMSGWQRSRWFDDTGLPWVNPSPNIRSVTQALLYAGIGLLEATNLSVGRGTDTPFEVVGAPWIDGLALAEALGRLGLPGVRFEPVLFTPAADKHAHVACGGVRLVVTDREAIRPVVVGLAIARTLRELYREDWRPESIQNLLVNRSTMWALLRDEPLTRLVAWAEMDRSSFLARRASYLIYP